MKYIKVIDKSSAALFDKHAKDHRAIVKYYAPWCGHCRELAPKWKNCCRKHGVKLNDDENEDEEFFYDDGIDDKIILAQASDRGIPHMESYNDVQGFPMIVYLENGKKVEEYNNEREEHKIHSWMKDKIISKQSGGKKTKNTKKRRPKHNKRTMKDSIIYCAHMPPHNGKHIKASKKHLLTLNNKTYSFRTCCNECAASMKKDAKNTPVKFTKDYVAKINKNYLLLKNKHSGKIVQKARINKSIADKSVKKKQNKKLLRGGTVKSGFSIGPFKFSKETGNKSWNYNSSGKMEAHDKDCYKLNGVGACKIKNEKSEKPWYSFW